MADDGIRQRITLSGEKEYNAALKEAQRNLRVLQSELKAETAELGANATAQQRAETRAKSLRQQIAEQEKIVQTLREALEKARTEYSDNEEVIAKWEQKLNNARTTLANMKNDLEGVGQGFQTINTDAAQATVATKSVADSLGNLSSIGESVSGAIESIFGTLLGAMEETIEKLWGLMTETAAKANNWTDLAGYYNSSAQDIQMWSRSIEAAGGKFENFMSVVSRLAFGGNEKKITELLGISKENYEDDVQYALAVLDELERRRDSMSKREFDNVMSDIFGAKRSQDVMWLLNNAHNENGTGWRDNPEQWNGETGQYGMSDRELGTMNDLYIVVCRIEEKWDAIKAKFAAGFGSIALDLLVNVEGVFDGIAEYMNATDQSGRDAALGKIRRNLEEFFRKLGDIIRESIKILRDVGAELEQSDDPVTHAIGSILTALTSALEWIVNHADEVKIALEAIFGFWLVAKLTAIGLKLASIVSQINMIKAFKGMGLFGGTETTTTTPTTTTTGAPVTGTGGTGGTIMLGDVIPLGFFMDEYRRIGAEFDQKMDPLEKEFAEYAKSKGYTPEQFQEIYGFGALDMDLAKKAGVSFDDYVTERLRTRSNMPPIDEDFDFVFEPNPHLTEDADIIREKMEDAWEDATDAFNLFTDYLTNDKDAEQGFLGWDASWWRNQGAGENNGITGADLRNFNGLPALIASAAQSGVAAGVSGLKVEMDGATVGWIVAPYVSEQIARDMG